MRTHHSFKFDVKQTLSIITLFILTAGFALADSSKVSRDLAGKAPGAVVDVIVQFRNAPTEQQHKKVKDKGGNLKSRLDAVKGALYSLPAAAINDLAADPDVVYISPDRELRGALDYANSTVGADIARNYGWDGSDIGVAVIDSGITVREDLRVDFSSRKSRIVYSESFIGSSATDESGHGTHVAGIVAGNGELSTGSSYKATFRGMAPKANLINLRVLDSQGSGTDSAVISAIQRAIQLKSTYNIRVINVSLGRPVFESYATDPLCQAVEAAWRAGIVVVVSAGNEGRNNSQGTNGYATISSPGNDPYVITVGAMKTVGTVSRADDVIASYSAKGPTLLDHVVKPDIVAPGNRIISLQDTSGQLAASYPGNKVLLSYYDKSVNGTSTSNAYFRLSGTSMAAPMVSGAAALLLQKNPLLTPDQVKARLMKTASKSFPMTSIATDPGTGVTYTSQYDIFTIGAGYLDVWAALNNSDVAIGAALSPTAVYDPLTGKVSVLFGTSLVWGDTSTWGTSLVWGDSVFLNGTSLVWGDSVVWGDKTFQGFSIVWGDSLVWGTSNQTSSESIGVTIHGEN